jgi:hypothetical protein
MVGALVSNVFNEAKEELDPCKMEGPSVMLEGTKYLAREVFLVARVFLPWMSVWRQASCPQEQQEEQ